MAWPVYSHRFIEVNAGTGWSVYYVPAGYVAIVKYLAGTNPTANAGNLNATVSNAYIYRSSIPVGGSASVPGMHAVGYENEQLALQVGRDGMHAHMSGFLIKMPPEGAAFLLDAPQIAPQALELAPLDVVGPGDPDLP